MIRRILKELVNESAGCLCLEDNGDCYCEKAKSTALSQLKSAMMECFLDDKEIQGLLPAKWVGYCLKIGNGC